MMKEPFYMHLTSEASPISSDPLLAASVHAGSPKRSGTENAQADTHACARQPQGRAEVARLARVDPYMGGRR
jgi:hypothetical protein